MSTVASETPLAPPAPGLLGGIANTLAEWGGSAIEAVSTVGDLTLFSLKTLAWLFTRAPKPGTLLPNFYQVGVLSLPAQGAPNLELLSQRHQRSEVRLFAS